MYPSSQKPYAGIYVKNLYERLKKHGSLSGVEILAMPRTFTGLTGSFLKYLHFFVRSAPYLFRHYRIVHLHFFVPLILWCIIYKLLHPRTQLVTTFHGSDIASHFCNPLSRWFGRILARAVNYTISVGREQADDIEQKLLLGVDNVIPAGINEELFYNEDIKKDIDFLFVGSFLPDKGLKEYIEALLEIDKRLDLAFVGSGPLRSEIELLEPLHNVKVYVNIEQNELRSIYNRARFTVLPTKREAFGLVVSESMYCGTPVLATFVGGIKEQLSVGENGLAIEECNSRAILKTLQAALLITNKEYKGFADVSLISNRDYSLESVVEKHIDIYQKLTLISNE